MMKGRLLLPFVLFMLAAGFAMDDHASASTEGVLRIGSATGATGEEVSVNLEIRGMRAPGIGAWSIDVAYDPAIVSLSACVPLGNNICPTDHPANVVRITGASANGVVGNLTIATLRFQCVSREGASQLTISTNIWGSAIPGPEKIPPMPELQNGIITCDQPPTPAPTSTPTAALPSAGYGNDAQSSWPLWPAGLLAIAALALVTGALGMGRPR